MTDVSTRMSAPTLARKPDRSNLLVIHFESNSIRIAPTREGVREAKRWLRASKRAEATAAKKAAKPAKSRKQAYQERCLSSDDMLRNMLEQHTCNGWAWVLPEQIGALTDAPIISEDTSIGDDGKLVVVNFVDYGFGPPCVYAFMDYQVIDPVAEWAAGKSTLWVKSEFERPT